MIQTAVLIDAHVHVYPDFDVSLLLDSAAANLAQQATLQGLEPHSWEGVLLLAETAACDWFNGVIEAGGWSGRGWTLHTVPDDEISLLARGSDGRKLLLIAGRQSATAEGLEVLSLCTRTRIPDGQSLERTVTAALDAGAVVVLPWAVGKWLGKRGTLIRGVLATLEPRIFAGDNGGRPWIWPSPAVFAEGERRDRPLISGTDPLPLRGAERCVGRFGFRLAGPLPVNQPGLALRDRLLMAKARSVQAFGRLETVRSFFRNQLMLRFH